jgi:RNA polymerase sigma factor (sigma-70 family)
VAQPSYVTALRHIRALFNVGTMGGLTDGQLLERFTVCDREAAELAFAALVERHGPMVLRVCQSVLRERHDAEDAFQATFLVLVRKAASIRKHSSVVSWLHGVAFRVASCQRVATARRHRYEQKVAELEVAPTDDKDRQDLASVLHEELSRLPDKYRTPIVLCYFEGLTHEQAARQLLWPVGTVRSRLARGRQQLRSVLWRRGMAPSIVCLERALRAEKASAVIPPALASVTSRAALHCISGNVAATGSASTSVALLVEGAMNVMFLTKIKFALLACGLIATGALVVAQQARVITPEITAQAAGPGVPANRPAHSAALDDDAAVARELGQLDLDLLTDEVHQLREEVEAALRDKLRAERTNSPAAKNARSAFELARASYLAKARELRTAQRLPGIAKDPREPGSHISAAAIGSIDIDAVVERYEKAKLSRKEYSAALQARKNELMRIMSEAQEEAQMLSKLAPGTEDYRKHENKVTQLKAQHEAGREQAERAFAQRQAKAMATLYNEIQEAVAAQAKAKGLTYVVKVSPGPRADSEPNDVSTALNRSVVYADPRNDLTEEVIRDLNRRSINQE